MTRRSILVLIFIVNLIGSLRESLIISYSLLVGTSEEDNMSSRLAKCYVSG